MLWSNRMVLWWYMVRTIELYDSKLVEQSQLGTLSGYKATFFGVVLLTNEYKYNLSINLEWASEDESKHKQVGKL